MDGCGVCKEMDYYLATLDKRLPIIKLDVNIFQQLANDNEIDKVPTSIFIQVQKDKVIWNSQQFIGIDQNGIGKILSQVNLQ
jgi:predicted transglutaminase-like protease